MASSTVKKRSCTEYHVAWICPVADVDLLPARLMLDEEHPNPMYDTHFDENTYICGDINGHNIVVATCPQGLTGNINAGRLTDTLFKTFPNIRMAVLVGTGGGIPRPSVPDPLDDVRLGDVIVGWPGDGKPACIFWEKSDDEDEVKIVGSMQNPDWRLTNALSILISDCELGMTMFQNQLVRLEGHKSSKKFRHPGVEHDMLFEAAYHHVGNNASDCGACDQTKLLDRPQRTPCDQKLVFHQGRIATSNTVVRDGMLRDQINTKCGKAVCIETEAAGVDINRNCLVIRGISDYADSHRSNRWTSYAAGNAAAFARELLCRVQSGVSSNMQDASELPWFVPFARPQSFAGRNEELTQLRSRLSADRFRQIAIYGLGGRGKTSLALEFLYQTREQHPCAIFWVSAISVESFEQAYQGIGMLLKIPGIEDRGADVKQLVKTKLSSDGFGPWLLVVDNADDINVLFDPLPEAGNSRRLIDYLPHSRKGLIVYTTRTRVAALKLARSNDIIALGDLSKAEAAEVLETHLLQEHQLQMRNEKAVHEFLVILTYLPLAIVQAVAFINATGISLLDYVAHFQKSKKDAAALLSEGSTGLEEQGGLLGTKSPVATTWFISFERIQKEDKLATEYLAFMACMENHDIPESLLMSSSTLDTIKAIGLLKSYAFISERQPHTEERNDQSHRSSKTYDVHPLVHLAMQEWLKGEDQWSDYAERLLAHLNMMIPYGNIETREVWTPYLPHALMALDMFEHSKSDARATLVERVARCELGLGRNNAAQRAFKQLLKIRQETLGEEHPETLLAMQILATALIRQGNYTEAETMLFKVLPLTEKVYGKEGRYTLRVMHNIGILLNRQGKYEESEKFHRQTLALRERSLGKEHVSTLSSMSEIAMALMHQGKYQKAEELLREVLSLVQEVVGKEHDEMLSCMGRVAQTLNKQGKYAEAETMHRETLALRQKVLGKEHPNALTDMNDIAEALRGQGKFKEAEKLHRETLALREKVSGMEHPNTLASVNNLAYILQRQEKYRDALPHYERAHAGFLAIFGPDHAWTQLCLRNYEDVQHFLKISREEKRILPLMGIFKK